VPVDDPRPWLYATARNLVWAEARGAAKAAAARPAEPDREGATADLPGLDQALRAALGSLSRLDAEALLLVAWEDLTPAQAARSLGITSVAFRVRLLRARRRIRARLESGLEEGHLPTPRVQPDPKGTR
jgi:RNA polymerase sigma-70 factor, ECF subfamily